jgi:hypothetical protein
MTERLRNSLLVLISILVALAACEFLLPFVSGVPIISLSNFRNMRAVQVVLSRASRYDSVLGWTMGPFL